MSSEPSERGIYVQKYMIGGGNDSWIDGGEHGLWVASGEVRSIEFFPVAEEGPNNA